MWYLEIILLAIGLSMDSFVASVASGTQIRNCTIKNIFKIALIMGALQAMLTLIGFLAGHGFERFITFYDHWIAFVLLSYLGGKMIYEGFKKDDSDEVQEVLSKRSVLATKRLIGLAIATSIDAMAVGISLGLLKNPIVFPVTMIGVITFIFSASGVYIGHKFGNKFNMRIELIGGIILILIGLKILLEHTIFA
ncbi:MAG TPA: hypothetical protein DCF91_12750 [Porphyromonadaceae bacterium]|nr:hypothetical protein [Porphyromonadaceae bacterium]